MTVAELIKDLQAENSEAIVRVHTADRLNLQILSIYSYKSKEKKFLDIDIGENSDV